MIAVEFSRYDIETGRIIARGRCPVQMVEWQEEDGTGLLPGRIDPATRMVVDGVVVDRPLFPITHGSLEIAAGGLDMVVFSGVPAGTAVRISAGAQPTELVVDDGALELDADTAGDYVIDFTLWPYQDLRVVVHAS